MKSTTMRREFSFLGIRLQDPDCRMTVEDVRGVLCTKSQNQNFLASLSERA